MGKSTKPLGWRPFIYGGAAAIFAETCTFPIDTSKTRLQIQGEVLSGVAKKFNGGVYRGMFHCIYSIGRKEGLPSLYRGLSAAIVRQMIYGTVKFGMYNHLKHAIFDNPLEETLIVDMILAMISGGFSNALANPADMMKIRLQAYVATTTKAPSMYRLFRKTVSEEGPLALYKGVFPTALRAAVVCGAELPTYDISKKWLIRSGWMNDTKECHFVSSFFAGLCGALLSNPIDMLRTRLLHQRRALVNVDRGQTEVYRNSFDCLLRTIRNEGVFALWKGFIPNWLRLGPWNIIFFMSFEQLNRLPF